MLIVNKIFRVNVLLLIYFYYPDTVNDLVLSQEDKPQTHKTVREISRETDIHRSSVSQIICKDLHLKCFKRCRA